MLNWLDSIWNLFTGGLAQLWHWIISGFKAIWSWTAQAVSILDHDIAVVANSLNVFARSVESFFTQAIDNLYHLALKWVTDLQHWTASLISRISSYIDNLSKWIISAVDTLIHAIEKAYSDIEHWVLSEIWNPLFHAVTRVIDWIEHEGSYVYDLVTHPEKLAALLAAYIWKSWLSLFRRYAAPIVSFIVSSFRLVIPDLMSVIEDILTRVL